MEHGVDMFFDSTFCQIRFVQEGSYIYVNWKGYQNLEQIKQGMERSLDCLVQKKCTKIFTDLRDAKGTFTAANDWIENDFMPKAIKLGYKYSAILYPSDVFTKFALQDLNKRYDKTNNEFKFQIFDNEMELKMWLTNS